jgi:hypothetical protein
MFSWFPALSRHLVALYASAFMIAAVHTAAAGEGPVRHVVHFRFKESATKEQIETVVKGFAALKSKIGEIVEMEHGTNVSPEGLHDGFTHCWIISFKDANGRDAYLVHPEHKKFVELLLPHLDKAFVVDFVPVKP